MRRPLDVPQNGKSASFRSCVRAGEAKLRVCVREIICFSVRWPSDSRILLRFASPSLMEHCVLHWFYHFFSIIVGMCMGFMPPHDLSMYGMGFIDFPE